MENLSLLERFANPDLIQSMSMGEKFLASGIVTILGMAITFVVLMVLWGLIIIMTKFVNGSGPKKETVKIAKPAAPAPQPVAAETTEDSEELIAVITAAIALSLNTAAHNIVVKNIVRMPDVTPAWGRAGRLEQMNRML